MPKYYDFMICGYYLYLSWRIIKERRILLAQHIGQGWIHLFLFISLTLKHFSRISCIFRKKSVSSRVGESIILGARK